MSWIQKPVKRASWNFENKISGRTIRWGLSLTVKLGHVVSGSSRRVDFGELIEIR